MSQEVETFPFTACRSWWFRFGGAVWATNGHFAVRLPMVDIGGESFGAAWSEKPCPDTLGPWSFACDVAHTHELAPEHNGDNPSQVACLRYGHGGPLMNARYVEAVLAAYPRATPRFMMDNCAPVAFVEGPVTVGIVMPMASPALWSPPEWVAKAREVGEDANHICMLLSELCDRIEEVTK